MKNKESNCTHEHRLYDLRDGRISAVHFGDVSARPKVVFANANGFNGLSYRAVLEPLGVHAIALDLRGHGMSELPTDIKSLKNWHIFRDDIIEFVERHISGKVILAGHSFGAVSAILAAPKLKDRLSGYVGFDPVTIPWLARNFSRLPGGRAMMKRRLPIARNAGRRRFVFESQEATLKRYSGRGAFKGIDDEILNDYLTGGLKPHEDGVQLACHPLWEQAIFTAQGHNLFKALPSLPVNTHIIYGGKAAVSSPRTRKAVHRKLKGRQTAYHREFHHLFPFHERDFATDVLRKALAGVKN